MLRQIYFIVGLLLGFIWIMLSGNLSDLRADPLPSGTTPTPIGDWQGSYECPLKTILELSVKDEGANVISAIFAFHIASQPSIAGALRMIGRRDDFGRFSLTPTTWVKQPRGFVTVNVNGRISETNNLLDGQMSYCGRFELQRTSVAFDPKPQSPGNARLLSNAIAEGVPVTLPNGIAGKIKSARSLLEQCKVLESWADPFLSRPDASTASVDILKREMLPIFDDAAFFPVFGLNYRDMSAIQRKPFFYLTYSTCAAHFGMRLNHSDIYRSFTDMPPDQPAFNAMVDSLADRHAALSQVAAVLTAAKSLGDDAAGLAKLTDLVKVVGPSVDQLAEPERTAFATAVSKEKIRIQNGIIRSRISAIATGSETIAGLSDLTNLMSDVERSDLPGDEKIRATQSIAARYRLIIASLSNAAEKDAQSATISLAGLGKITALMRDNEDSLKAVSGAQAIIAPYRARREIILATPSVQKDLENALVAVAVSSGSLGRVLQTADRYLEPAEYSDGGSEFRNLIVKAQNKIHVETEIGAAAPQGGVSRR